jgi:flagellar basal body P-ring protein FlgI
MALVGIQAKEKATMNLELEKIRNSGEIDFETWTQNNRVREAQNESMRNQTIQNAQAGVEVAKLNADIKREGVSVDLEVSEHKTKQAMDLFEQVQARKRDRMQMDSEQEQQRLDKHAKSSDKTIEVLENIAASATDPMVQMEALKQLAELRKADVTGQKDAYKN